MDNARKVLSALDHFGFSSLGISLADLTADNNVIQLGYPPCRIDLLTSIDGVDFDTCYARRLQMSIDGMELFFIGLDDFKTNKLACGRHKDLADLESLSSLPSPKPMP